MRTNFSDLARHVLTLSILIPLSGCASDFTTNVDVRNDAATGKLQKRLVSMYRDKKLLLQRFEILDRKTGETNTWGEQIFFQGKRVLFLLHTKTGTERTYFPESGAGIGEMDKNKDGLPDQIAIINPKGELYDAVKRGTNGFLEPVSKETLSNVKEMLPRFEKGFRDLKNQDWPKDLDDEK